MDFIQQNLMLVALFVFSGAAVLWQFTLGSGRGQIGPVEATRLINQEDALIIDVRDPAEFAAGHLPDARNIPLDKLGERAAELEKDKTRPLLVVCAAGMRSAKGCSLLVAKGFTRAVGLAGGVDAWVAAGYPIHKGNRK